MPCIKRQTVVRMIAALAFTIAGSVIAMAAGPDWTVEIDYNPLLAESSSPPRFAVELDDRRIALISNRLSILLAGNTFDRHVMRTANLFTRILRVGGNELVRWTSQLSDISTSHLHCDLRRMALDGGTRWQVNRPGVACNQVAAMADDEIAVFYRDNSTYAGWLAGLSGRGMERWRSATIEGVMSALVLRDASRPQVYLVTAAAQPPYGSGRTEVRTFNFEGDLLSQWRSQDGEELLGAEPDPLGGLMMSTATGDVLNVSRWTTAGQMTRSAHQSSFGERRRVIGSTGRRAFVVGESTHLSNQSYVLGLTSTGVEQWRHEIPQDGASSFVDAYPTRNGDLIVLRDRLDRLTRLSPTGEIVATVPIEDRGNSRFFFERSDGELLIGAVDGLQVIGRDGVWKQSIAIPNPRIGLSSSAVSLQPRLGGGAAYVVSDYLQQQTLIGLDGTGARIYARPLADTENGGIAQDCGTGWFCVRTQSRVEEFDIGQGLPGRHWDGSGLGRETFSRGRDGVLTSPGDGYVVWYDNSGPVPTYGRPFGIPLAVSPGGEVLAVAGESLFKVSRDGSETRYLPEQAVDALIDETTRPPPLTALLDTNGVATLLVKGCPTRPGSPCADTIQLKRVDASREHWSISTGAPSSRIADVSSRQVIDDGAGGVFALVGLADADGRPHQLFILHVGANGELRWRRRWTQSGDGPAELFHVRSPGTLALVWHRVGAWEPSFVTLDARTGELRAERSLTCPDAPCANWRVRLGDDGAVVAAGMGPERGWVMGRDSLMAPAPPIAMDQSGLTNAWFAPRSSGQGFSLRYFPESRTIFMPWFTFSPAGSNEATDLRWYALQGDIEPGATRAMLAIVERTGGVFDERPADPLAIVGEAKLHFSSCDTGVLEFAFHSGEHQASEGTVALQSLLPAGQSCVDNVGTHAAAASYDAMSGSWYDPATSGQGLELSRVAPTGGNPGLLYATWFTFDPVQASGEASDQHWFTLQGQAAGDDGAVRTTIVQTIGGRFDADPTANTFRVGSAELVPQGCDRLTLRYTFDDSIDAGEFRGLAGEIPLQRIGACPTN